MIKRMNVLIVPDEGGQSRRLNLPVFILKFAAWSMLILIAVFVVAVFSYSRFAIKALDWSRLAAENERLTEENRRVLRVTREIAESRSTLVNLFHTYRAQKMPIPDSLFDAVSSAGVNGLSPESVAILKDQMHSPAQFLQRGLPTVMPVAGFLSQRFLEDPFFPERSHLGIDIAGRESTPIVAAASGNVIFEGWTSYFGNCLIIAHRDGYVTFYGHCRQNLRKLAEEVKRGEPIALLGSTGHSSAPHLHFEIWKDGVPVDPLKLLQMK